jgi:hypothetical protein
MLKKSYNQSISGERAGLMEPMVLIRENDLLFSEKLNLQANNPGTRKVARLVKETKHANIHHNNLQDCRSKVIMKRYLLEIVDELRHSKDGTTCRCIKAHKTNYPG